MHACSAEAATHMLQALITTSEQTYIDMRDQCMASGMLSPEVVRYVEAVGALAAGTSVWSASCPRYNMHRVLDSF